MASKVLPSCHDVVGGLEAAISSNCSKRPAGLPELDVLVWIQHSCKPMLLDRWAWGGVAGEKVEGGGETRSVGFSGGLCWSLRLRWFRKLGLEPENAKNMQKICKKYAKHTVFCIFLEFLDPNRPNRPGSGQSLKICKTQCVLHIFCIFFAYFLHIFCIFLFPALAAALHRLNPPNTVSFAYFSHFDCIFFASFLHLFGNPHLEAKSNCIFFASFWQAASGGKIDLHIFCIFLDLSGKLRLDLDAKSTCQSIVSHVPLSLVSIPVQGVKKFTCNFWPLNSVLSTDACCRCSKFKS